MSSPARNTTRRGGYTAGIAGFMRRRVEEAAGLALGLGGLALFVAIISYDSADPSLNSVGGGLTANWMGRPGALVSDVLIQSVGMASVLLSLILAVWGWRLARHRFEGRLWVRLLSLPLALLLGSIALAGLTSVVDAPLHASWGGATGEILLGNLHDSFPGRLGVPTWSVSVVAAALTAVALVAALGLSTGEWGTIFSGVGRAGAGGARAGLRGGRVGAAAGGALIAALWRRRGETRQRLREEPELARPARPAVRDSMERREPTLAPVEPAEPAMPDRRALVQPTPSRPRRVERQGSLNLGGPADYDLPPLDELDPPPPGNGSGGVDEIALEENARLLETVLQDFGVKGEIVKVRPGPVVTLYELEPAPGTKSSRVIGLADDIARSMSAISVRVAVIPGRNVIGIELPNAKREIVYLRELLSSSTYERSSASLALSLGKDIGGSPVIGDLARMPHLLIAGTTGSGKSVGINTMILSLLYRLSPERCKFIMIDPKMLELSVYDGIPHLLAPVVTDPKEAVTALRWVVREMENRYREMSNMGVRNIAGYNARLAEARKRGESLTRTVQTGFDPETGKPAYEEQALDMEPLPFIVVIVDEMADLMLVAGKEVEAAVQRLAQMARAAGIHLIMATQRPSVDVITGTIKANFPTRVSFQVTSKIDSRTILGESGAEQLLGQGDMLYMAGGGRITRVHGPLVTDEEVERVVAFLRDQGEPNYLDEVTDEDAQAGFPSLGLMGGGDSGDELYDRAVALVCRERKASTSFVQRHLQIGYNRAARIIEQMEAEGVVSRANHVGKREVLARDFDDINS